MTVDAATSWTLEPLRPQHARALAGCHIACWREAYRGLVPDHVLDAFDIERRAEQWARIARNPGRTDNLLALVDGAVVGFIGYGPPHDGPAVAQRELHALYVRAEWYGTGLAHTLLRTLADPERSCFLWVFQDNPRARAFYTKYGFAPDGTARAERFTLAPEIRMIRPPGAWDR